MKRNARGVDNHSRGLGVDSKMTVERKIVVGLDDIQAVTFECGKCHSRITVPPDDIRDIPCQCARCGQPWLVSEPSRYETIADPAVNFTKGIQTIRTLVQNKAMGFRILLEFPEPRGFDD
jgi:hypothetical protein